MKKRLFIAIEIPEELRCEIPSVILRTSRKTDFSAKGFKPVNPEHLHLTLRFIGDFPEENIPAFIERLKDISFSKFSISTTTPGFFPNIRRPSVFFLGFSAPLELLQLKSDIDEVLEKFGIDRESRDYVPHLTLGRFKRRPEKEIPDNLEKQAALSLRLHSGQVADISFSVNEFILFSSRLTQQGAIHTVEARF